MNDEKKNSKRSTRVLTGDLTEENVINCFLLRLENRLSTFRSESFQPASILFSLAPMVLEELINGVALFMYVVATGDSEHVSEEDIDTYKKDPDRMMHVFRAMCREDMGAFLVECAEMVYKVGQESLEEKTYEC